MLTTYIINKRITDFAKMDDNELKAVYGLTRKQANSRLHYYLKGKPATKRIDHATPAHKVAQKKDLAVVTQATAKLPIARDEVYSKPVDNVAKLSHVLLVVAILLLITIVWVNIAR